MHSCSDILQNSSQKHMAISFSTLVSIISDHLPCIVILGISEKTAKRKKYVRTRTMKETVIKDFREALSAMNISSLLNANLSTDPNIDYEKFEKKHHRN